MGDKNMSREEVIGRLRCRLVEIEYALTQAIERPTVEHLREILGQVEDALLVSGGIAAPLPEYILVADSEDKPRKRHKSFSYAKAEAKKLHEKEGRPFIVAKIKRIMNGERYVAHT